MADAMLSELYMRAFETKREAERLTHSQDKGDTNDRLRQVALAKNHLLTELIDVRTEQLKNGR